MMSNPMDGTLRTRSRRASRHVGLLGAVAVVCLVVATSVQAQQRIAHIDSEYVLGLTPEYATVQQQVDRLAQGWRTEIDERRRSVDEMFREYQARELLYTNEERQRKRDEILRAEDELERLRMRYFGPEGELFQQQDNLMRPIQERVLEAIEQVAQREGYDYVIDLSGDFLFLFAREQNDISDEVLSALGIDTDNNARGARR
jgi:outer membrane protein